jgi:hypothetical protein
MLAHSNDKQRAVSGLYGNTHSLTSSLPWTSIFFRLPVLRHQDDGCLDGRQHWQQQVQQNVRIRIENVALPGQNERVQTNPDDQDGGKDANELPGAAEPCNGIGDPLAERRPGMKILRRVS